ARIGVVDRLFARVGASDNLAQGRSTFMVEMIETASILAHATPKSLLLFDEIGRGTSTFDGVSIAWAVAEFLHDRVKARTLFATHYHELTELAITRSRVRNWSVAVKEWQDEVIFLRKLIPGATGRSYGIQVARLAGLPKSVVERAKEVLGNLEVSQIDAHSRPALARSRKEPEQLRDAGPHQLDLFAPLPVPSRVEQLLTSIEPDSLSPRQALELIYQLRQLVGAS
ncbi:MAG: DNA mismatch repair protein MutS, partial [Deltaproteobacteria bacterium]|nr:DNA mismatch repair protein MutS [Deltaproteobacteria bacterium]